MVVRKDSQVIGKVEIVELRQECPLYANVPVWCGNHYDPVNNQEEHLKTIGHLVSMGKPACHALVGVADQGNELFMYSIVSQYYHNVSRSTVSNTFSKWMKLFPFQWLLNTDTQTGYLISIWYVASKTRLMVSKLWVNLKLPLSFSRKSSVENLARHWTIIPR